MITYNTQLNNQENIYALLKIILSMKIKQPIRLFMLFAILCFSIASYAAKGKQSESITESVQQKTTLKGTIVDATGPVIGATVAIKEHPGRGTVTDINGDFTIEVSKGETLRITFLGYVTQDIKYNGEATMDIMLKEDAHALDELVVVGYGIQKKANLTGSVATINSTALESRSASSVSAALAGQMPGVTAIQTSGAPGAQTGSITIRGKNSINAAPPLVIIDGVPSSVGGMNSIDPMDIESMSVLKDAASSAIYGVQAANGVIVITTKKGGLNQKARINYSGSVAWTKPVTRLKFLGSEDYARLYNEATLNENPNAILMYTEKDFELFRNGSSPFTHPDTDWYNEVFRSHATETYHNLSINGGTNNTTYNGAIGYTNQGSLVDQDENYERFNVRLAIDSKINSWLTAGLNISGFKGTEKRGWDTYAGLIGMANRIPPTYLIKNEDGTYNFNGQGNPMALRGNSGQRHTVTQEENALAYLTVNVLPELSVKGLFSARHNHSQISNFKKRVIYGNSKSTGDTGEREGEARENDHNWYTGQLLANYNKTFLQDHTVSFLAGYEQVEYKYKWLKATRKGGGSDELPETISSLNEASQTNENKGYGLTRASYFGRAQYDFKNKYLFEFNIRRDASSRFHKDSRWGTFPAISAGWRVTEEDFMRNADWLSNLKIRLGYGKTGNEELPADVNYPTLATYGFDKYYLGSSLYSTTKDARMADKSLKWAEVTNYELGLEASFLNNQIGFELELYKKNTDGMLLMPMVPGVLGLGAPYQNAGKVTNTGFDLRLFHNKVINKDWNYSVNFNIAYVKNKITKMEGGNSEMKDTDGRKWFLEGYAIGTFYGYKADGFFNTQEELAAGPKRTGAEKLGDIRYVDMPDANGIKDGKITAADRVAIGQDYPDWTAGLNINVAYKAFDLSMLFQGAFGASAYITHEGSYAFFNGGKVLERHLDRWTPDNHNASYPRITKDTQINYVTSSFWLQNTDYVRLKNISVGYNLSKNVLSKVGIERARLYVSGENLITFSDLDGIDPEAPSINRGAFYGNVKKIALGLKVTF